MRLVSVLTRVVQRRLTQDHRRIWVHNALVREVVEVVLDAISEEGAKRTKAVIGWHQRGHRTPERVRAARKTALCKRYTKDHLRASPKPPPIRAPSRPWRPPFRVLRPRIVTLNLVEKVHVTVVRRVVTRPIRLKVVRVKNITTPPPLQPIERAALERIAEDLADAGDRVTAGIVRGILRRGAEP